MELLCFAVGPGYEIKLHPVSCGKFAPQKFTGGAIFSQTAIVKHSPLGDLLTIAVCEKIASMLFDREKIVPTTAIY